MERATSIARRGSASTNLIATLLVGVVLVVGWLWYARTHAAPGLGELLASAEVPAAPLAYEFDPAIGVRNIGVWDGPGLHRAGTTERYTFTTRRMDRGGAVRARPSIAVRVRVRVLAETDTWAGVASGAGFIDGTTASKGAGGVLADTQRAWAAGSTDEDGLFGVDVKLEIPSRDGPEPYRLEIVADEFEASADESALELIASTVYSVDVSLP